MYDPVLTKREQAHLVYKMSRMSPGRRKRYFEALALATGYETISGEAPDAHANLAKTTVATAPSPATSGTTLSVAAGGGALMPAVPFNFTVGPASGDWTPANTEIIRCTARTTDSFGTIVRAQEGSAARTVVVGDKIVAGVTAKSLTDIENSIPTLVSHTEFSSVQSYGNDPTSLYATIVTAPAFTADGSTAYLYEFWSSQFSLSGSSGYPIIRFTKDGASLVSWSLTASNNSSGTQILRYREVPAAGSRTIAVQGYEYVMYEYWYSGAGHFRISKDV